MMPDGRIALALKTPCRDGTVGILLTAIQLVARLAPLEPACPAGEVAAIQAGVCPLSCVPVPPDVRPPPGGVSVGWGAWLQLDGTFHLGGSVDEAFEFGIASPTGKMNTWPMKRRQKVIAVIAIIVACLVGLGWRRLDTPRGDVRVDYRPAQAACTDDPAGFRFCVYRAPEGNDTRVAYHLHGRHLDEHAWNDDTYYTAMIQKRWADEGVRPPVVVSVSFGPVYLLAARGAREASGLLEVFRDRVLPAVEAQTGPAAARAVFGESMGGINALSAGLALPGVFQRVVALCPPLHEVSPFADWGTVWDALERTGAQPKLALAIRSIAREYFADDAEWQAFSPLALVGRRAPPDAPSLYLSVGLYDPYGSYPGAETFVRRARENGWRVDWRPLYGGHCAVDIASVADALAAP